MARERRFGVELEFGIEYGNEYGPPECTCGDDVPWGDCDYCYGEWDSGGVEFVQDLIAPFNEKHTIPGATRKNGRWAVHSDGTEVEVSSPILQGAAGFRELKAVMEVLNKNGAYVTEEDGLHVHHEALDFKDDDDLRDRLVDSWVANQPVMNEMVAEWRVGHHYCEDYWTQDPYAVDEIKAKRPGDRYYSLNLLPLDYQGTIEFRQHEGTMDFNQVYAWVKFGQAFLDGVVKRKRPMSCAESVPTLLRRTKTAPAAALTLMAKAAA